MSTLKSSVHNFSGPPPSTPKVRGRGDRTWAINISVSYQTRGKGF